MKKIILNVFEAFEASFCKHSTCSSAGITEHQLKQIEWKKNNITRIKPGFKVLP